MKNDYERDGAKSCETIRDRLNAACRLVPMFERKSLEIVGIHYGADNDSLHIIVRKGHVWADVSYVWEQGDYAVCSSDGNEMKWWSKDDFGEKAEWADIAEWIARKDDWE